MQHIVNLYYLHTSEGWGYSHAWKASHFRVFIWHSWLAIDTACKCTMALTSHLQYPFDSQTWSALSVFSAVPVRWLNLLMSWPNQCPSAYQSQYLPDFPTIWPSCHPEHLKFGHLDILKSWRVLIFFLCEKGGQCLDPKSVWVVNVHPDTRGDPRIDVAQNVLYMILYLIFFCTR